MSNNPKSYVLTDVGSEVINMVVTYDDESKKRFYVGSSDSIGIVKHCECKTADFKGWVKFDSVKHIELER